MTIHYILSPSGRNDLDDIWLFIAKNNPSVADRVEGELIAAMRMLGDYPLSGHLREDLTSQKVRFWSVYSFMIIYDPQASPVHILRVISSYRDIASLL